MPISARLHHGTPASGHGGIGVPRSAWAGEDISSAGGDQQISATAVTPLLLDRVLPTAGPAGMSNDTQADLSSADLTVDTTAQLASEDSFADESALVDSAQTNSAPVEQAAEPIEPGEAPPPGETASTAGAAAVAEEDDLDSHRFECRSCGYVYDPGEGVKKLGIPQGTPFFELDAASFRCPVCRSKVGAFKDIGPRNKPSGFEENLNFGLGVNRLTPGQKNVLIFGGFALAIAFFLSLYSLR
jgi:rubredoxin